MIKHATIRSHWLVLAAIAVGLPGLAGCDKPTTKPATQGQAQSLPTTSVRVGNRTFVLEIAADDPTRQTGLMFRESMPADRGMIFVFPGEEVLGFYMRNTRIPLDIIYADRTGRVVSIKQMQPLDLRTVSSDDPAMYAIELNQGTAQAAGVKVGDTIQIPAEVRAADRPGTSDKDR